MTKVIPWKNMPTKLPVWTTIVAWLMLDRLQPAGWIYGVVWTVFALVWIFSAVAIWQQEQVSPYGGDLKDLLK